MSNLEKEGSKQSVTELVDKYQSQLKSFIRKRVSSKEDAEDILQDVFFQLAKADYLANPIEQVSAWLYRVTKNIIFNRRIKKKEEEMPFYSDNEDDDVLENVKEVLLSDDNTPEMEYIRSLFWTELKNALLELPTEQQQVFEKTELEGLSVKEIAEQMGVPVNTILSRKRYAVLHLRNRLKDLYYEFLDSSTF